VAVVDNVEQPPETTAEKKLGGVTGKGFLPGKSGNPDGARGSVAKLVKDLCRENPRGKIEQVIQELYGMALSPKPSLIKLEAVKYIIDRVAGKPTQAIAGEDGEPLKVGLVILPVESAE
jgi:hypothetical protein